MNDIQKELKTLMDVCQHNHGVAWDTETIKKKKPEKSYKLSQKLNTRDCIHITFFVFKQTLNNNG
jgi:hypothetical protein